MPHVNAAMTTAERFWSKVEELPNGCMEWRGALSWNGYGRFQLSPRQVNAHRWSYEQAHGLISEGLQIDHLCRNRACVNPDHLEPVTNRENNIRRVALITHCPKGHCYDDGNTRINRKGARECRTCERERSKGRPRRSACSVCGEERDWSSMSRHRRVMHTNEEDR